MGLIATLLIPLGVLGALGALITFLVRGASDALTARSMLRAYLRVGFLVSLGIGLVGAAMVITAALASAFGHAFSYAPSGALVCPSPPFDTCAGGPALPPDTRQQDDYILGTALLVAGVIVGAGHKVVQRIVETRDERRYSALARIEALLGTGVVGVVSIVALPIAVAAIVRHLVVADHGSSFSSPAAPGGSIAEAVVLVPVWLTYLIGTLRSVIGAPGRDGTAPPRSATAVEPARG